MSTRKIEVHSKETWRARLGVALAGLEGVRLGWCWHDGRYYKPVEIPPYVSEFLCVRIVPADPMWPFYIHESFKTLEEAMAGLPGFCPNCSENPRNFSSGRHKGARERYAPQLAKERQQRWYYCELRRNGLDHQAARDISRGRERA